MLAVAALPTPKLDSPAFKADPFPFYARLLAEAPVHHIKMNRKRSAWLVSRYEDVVYVLKDPVFVKNKQNAQSPDQLQKQPWMPSILKPFTQNMVDQDDPNHSRLRRLVHQAFTPRLVETLRNDIQVLADELLHKAGSGPFELVSQYALPLPMTIIARLLGVPAEDQHVFHRWCKHLVSVTSASDLPHTIPTVWSFTRYLRRIFKQRRADPRDDLITGLVQAEEAGDILTEDELLAMIFLLLLAGHETTVSLIANGTLALLQHPEQLALLRENPALIKSAVEEILRYTSPSDIGTDRFPTTDVIIRGVTIPRGELVLPVLGAANRDEQQFVNADQFDITRDPNRHLTFGHGAHYCMGAPLGRLEGEIALLTIIQRLPNLKLAETPDRIRWHCTQFTRGVEWLPLSTS